MISYKGLPSRVRRIVGIYEYCIETVIENEKGIYSATLKDGYESGSGFPWIVINVNKIETAIYAFKAVTKPCSRVIRTALFGFLCPICNGQVLKGSNYTDLGGMRICTMCG